MHAIHVGTSDHCICAQCSRKFTPYRRQVCLCIMMLSIICNACMHGIDCNDFTFFFSITAINAWLQCVIAAPSTSYPLLTHHPSLEESVITALMTLQLNAIMKVRFHWNQLKLVLIQSIFKPFRSTIIGR